MLKILLIEDNEMNRDMLYAQAERHKATKSCWQWMAKAAWSWPWRQRPI